MPSIQKINCLDLNAFLLASSIIRREFVRFLLYYSLVFPQTSFRGVANTLLLIFLITFSSDANLQSWTERVENFSYSITGQVVMGSILSRPHPGQWWPLGNREDQITIIDSTLFWRMSWGGKYSSFCHLKCVSFLGMKHNIHCAIRNSKLLFCPGLYSRWESYPKCNVCQYNS